LDLIQINNNNNNDKLKNNNMSDFLDNLKKSVDTGDFNSEAAKKITSIVDFSDEKMRKNTINEISNSLDARNVSSKTVSSEEAKSANTEYEIKMGRIKQYDRLLGTIAELNEIDRIVSESIDDMKWHITNLEEVFDMHDPINELLAKTINEVKIKYNLIFSDSDEKSCISEN
jgi:hypothetical protein